MSARACASAVAAAVIVLAGCSPATTAGHGTRAGAPAPSASTSPGFPSSGVPSSGVPASGGASSGGPSGAASYRRQPAQTPIGDPPTRDLCSVAGDAALARRKVVAAPYEIQTAASCALAVTDDSSGKDFTVRAAATLYRPFTAKGRTTRTVSGLTVYAFPYSSDGDCERDVATTEITIKVDASAEQRTPSRTVACRTTDAVVDLFAAALAAGRTLPALDWGSRPLVRLDACAVVRGSDITSLSTLRGVHRVSVDFDAGCQFTANKFFVQIEPGSDDQPIQDRGLPTVSVGGHTLYVDRTRPKQFCTFTSPQGTADDRFPRIDATASVYDPRSTLSTGVCDDAGRLLAAYLTTAGLR